MQAAAIPPVNLADPAAVAAWIALARGKVEEIHPFIVDATARKAHRKHAQVYLRATMTRILRDVGVLLDALTPRGDAPHAPAPADDDRPPWETPASDGKPTA